ncbi:MAG: hypothetical protein ACLVH0_01085 [Coprococcus eutactus]
MEIGEARKKVKGATWFFASLIGVYLIVLAVLMLSGLGGKDINDPESAYQSGNDIYSNSGIYKHN